MDAEPFVWPEVRNHFTMSHDGRGEKKSENIGELLGPSEVWSGATLSLSSRLDICILFGSSRDRRVIEHETRELLTDQWHLIGKFMGSFELARAIAIGRMKPYCKRLGSRPLN